jgi:hypothetical protein
MRLCAAATCLMVVGCLPGPDDDGTDQTEEHQQLLSAGQDQGAFLTRPRYDDDQEASRRKETDTYYATVRIGADGKSGGTIASSLNTLDQFINQYQFVAREVNTFYYNRGDLGIGREMHCVDRVSLDGQVACYVKNFAAGDDGSEFTFGLSSNIAFQNMKQGNAFATVAMVFRNRASGVRNKVFFVVYDANGKLQNFAALDRHGVNFAQAFAAGGGKNNPPSELGSVGFGGSVNLHIPSNCMSCHGGFPRYNSVAHAADASLFLPFDLDQFEYEDVGGHRRSDQLGSFQAQNEMVRKVAALGNYFTGTSEIVVSALDGWYHNTTKQSTDAREVFEHDFDSSFLPSGWTSQPQLYQQVVRGTCRSCHVTHVGAHFDTESEFRSQASTIVLFLCGKVMPHSLQSYREFWQSTRPQLVAQYLRDIGKPDLATKLEACGPGDVATLDPPLVMASGSFPDL